MSDETYGGITRDSIQTQFEYYQVSVWRNRILAGWEKYGTGRPLDPKTVEHLAKEFAKPFEWPTPKFEFRDPFEMYFSKPLYPPGPPRERFKTQEEVELERRLLKRIETEGKA